MAKPKRKSRIERPKYSRPTKFFYLEGKLYKRLHVNRGEDVLTAWSYPDHKRVGFTYSDIMRRKETAFRTREVAWLINRTVLSIDRAISRGDFEPPQHEYSLSTGGMKAYYWAEADVLRAHDYFCTVHRGRPRKDGLITPQGLPTKRELRAMMRNEDILYVKTGDGEFKPTWRADTF